MGTSSALPWDTRRPKSWSYWRRSTSLLTGIRERSLLRTTGSAAATSFIRECFLFLRAATVLAVRRESSRIFLDTSECSSRLTTGSRQTEPSTTQTWPASPTRVEAGDSSRRFGKEVFDLVHFFIVQTEVASAHDAFSLAGIAGTDDGSRNCRMLQRPGDCDFTDGTVVAFRDLSQALDQFQVAGKIWFGKVGMTSAPVVFRQFGGALTGHGAGQQT